MSSPLEDWNRLVEKSEEIDQEELRRAVQELLRTFDEGQRVQSEGLICRNPEVHSNFPTQLNARADKVKNDAKPCPHCRGRGRDANGKMCEACTGTGEIKLDQGTT